MTTEYTLQDLRREQSRQFLLRKLKTEQAEKVNRVVMKFMKREEKESA